MRGVDLIAVVFVGCFLLLSCLIQYYNHVRYIYDNSISVLCEFNLLAEFTVFDTHAACYVRFTHKVSNVIGLLCYIGPSFMLMLQLKDDFSIKAMRCRC
jgi:hypothetical protein